VRHGWHRLGQVGGDCPTLEQKAEKASQGRGDSLGVTGAISARLPQQEAGDISGAARLEPERWGIKPIAEKTPDRIEVGAHGCRRQATRLQQVVLKVGRNGIARTTLSHDNWGGNHPVLAQLRAQPPQDGSVTTVRATVPITVLQKGVNALCVEVRCREVVSLEPAAEVGE
jgi:hypothetical protein